MPNQRGRGSLTKYLGRLRPLRQNEVQLRDQDTVGVSPTVVMETQSDGSTIIKNDRNSIRISAPAMLILNEMQPTVQYAKLQSRLARVTSNHNDEQLSRFIRELNDRDIIRINEMPNSRRGRVRTVKLPQSFIAKLNDVSLPQIKAIKTVVTVAFAVTTWNTAYLITHLKLPSRTLNVKHLFTCYLASVILIFLHELGHAIAVRWNNVEIGGVEISVSISGVLRGRTRSKTGLNTLTASEQLLILVAGPLTDTLVARALKRYKSQHVDTLALMIIGLNTIPHRKNDGRMIMDILSTKLKG